MTKSNIRRGYVDTRFGQSHVYAARPSAGSDRVPLVCFHMSPWGASYFEPLLAAMQSDRLAVAVDSPGYGNSDGPTSPTVEDYAGAMSDVIDALGLDRIDLLGDRTGAKIAIELARSRPELVRRLVLISPVVWTDAERTQRREFAPETLTKDGSHLAAMWTLNVGLGMKERTLADLGRIFYSRLQNYGKAHLGRRAAGIYKAREALTELDKPIMVLRPADELWALTPRVAPYLTHADSRILDLPDWGLGFVQVKAAETAELLREFLG